ncbi:tRNA (N(6)-L-threonylcarbamoyladenosine(37)-C(2))-methylthiotransferase MtaB [Altererythrobacter indicus]|uniref:tRNA (N(6)-L-threonylcarbamoyladenosine(37)-C(2))-methylthiotransferase MtaB n=1 Tax=Altericroceibacterium indicum TaxID=374177 RepID=A0A845ABU4_9SPHN|nr:tRNA (N(6)-L-threonylcarbamoyladenosine(37)-C(2))-methylthiotransferase MtaB [Altericroceibacterium indicum]MXP24648.1 tRNA (N(6)-L-threonylcarbamoyladenosine(37)-C(2))-methylthiotransferase MtaB [Altericroceibacterium indicum]
MTAPQPTPSKAEVISLGCRLNISESEQIRAMLADESDVIVINSCAVTSEAVRQTRQAIRRARRNRPDARLLVTGCAAEIEREQLAAMPEVDGLIANTQKLDARAWNVPVQAEPVLPKHTRAFVTVQNGCDHACTFCVIPQGRGTSRSLTIPQVLGEVERHLSQGAMEVVLTGVDVTSWGEDLPDRPPLGRLVRSILDQFPTLERLRMSSLDGVEIDAELFELFAFEERIMPHLHLSLQSGDDMILKRMKRRHLRRDAVDLVERLKRHRSNLSIGADIIAGFPTETDAMHANNLSIIAELGIVHGHIFPYSPRPGTPAARMPQVDRAIVKQRASELRAETLKIRDEWLRSLIGREQQVLAEKDGTGYGPSFARVAVPEGIAAGRIVTITPTKLEEGLLQ